MLFPAALIALFFPLNTRFGWIASDIVLLCTRACFAFQVIWVWVRGFRLLQSTQQRLDNTYTDYRSHLLNPTRLLLILIGITAVVSTLLNILGRECFDGSLLVGIPAILMSVLLFSLGYVAAHSILPKETVAQEEETVVEHAQQVLRDPQYTSDHEAVTNAIALSGFASDQTFYSIFKELTGLTPLKYRQQNRQK